MISACSVSLLSGSYATNSNAMSTNPLMWSLSRFLKEGNSVDSGGLACVDWRRGQSPNRRLPLARCSGSALDRHMEEPPGPIHLSPFRDKIKREYGNIDFTFIRDQCRHLALRAWNRRKITRMMDRENDPEPETSGRGSWTESWIAGC